MSSDETDRVEGLRTRTVRIIRESTGLHERLATPIASEIVEAFRREFGGERVYFPASDPYLAAKVMQEFNGRNHKELCRRYQISRSTFYNFLSRAKQGRPSPPEPSEP